MTCCLALWACGEADPGKILNWTDVDELWAIEEAYPLAPEMHLTGAPDGPAGLSAAVDDSDTAVWEVTADWEDVDTPSARRSGIAWAADSGLDWDQKYARWVDSMSRTASHDMPYDTYALSTPWGKTLPAPNLECAETSIFLRATFAAWHGLPFYMVAIDNEGPIYFGHFGALRRDGRYLNMSFRRNYTDHRSALADQPAADIVADWPQDAELRRRRLGANGDDLNGFLGENAGAGAYFDEIFLNKRVGYFLNVLLSYYGSVHLASSSNTFDISPIAIREGDSLIERWQREGIGHTLIVKHVDAIDDMHREVELVSGSMPRRQGKWEASAASRGYFTNQYCGGRAMSREGVTYAELGGGLKRWRIPKMRNGRWHLDVPRADRAVHINSADIEALGARPETFGNVLRELPPLERRDALLERVGDARLHLERYPASCSARINREAAFRELYALMEREFGWDRARTDETYRVFADYVFAELVYEQSKTCCWNTSTRAMSTAIVDSARARVRAQADGQCVPPPVFKATGGGYADFAADAEADGVEWVPWNDDEPCPQRDTMEDIEAESSWTPACEFMPTLLGEEERPPEPEVSMGDGGSSWCINAPQWSRSPGPGGMMVLFPLLLGLRRRTRR